MGESTPRRASANSRMGARFESIAAKYYENLGYKILARNWRSGRLEIDLVISRGTRVRFVEVKGGKTDLMGHPAYRVDSRKREKLIRAAQAFLQTRNEESADSQWDYAFEALIIMRTITGIVIERFEDAFGVT